MICFILACLDICEGVRSGLEVVGCVAFLQAQDDACLCLNNQYLNRQQNNKKRKKGKKEL